MLLNLVWVLFLMKGLKALKMLKSTITMRGHIMKRLIMKLMPAMIFKRTC